jgi:hypothetical protein
MSETTDRMNLRLLVTESVKARGRATADDILPDLARFGFTRDQITKALANARTCGWLHSEGRNKRVGVARDQRLPTTYFPVTTAMDRIARALSQQTLRPMVASVWELGTPKPEDAWPKEMATGTVYTLLGPWNSEEHA